jgi:NTP pyrophosphatase (non-canonical NTP hydrolase)
VRLYISISLEYAELLEVFEWSGEDVKGTEKIDKIKEELADVVNYCVFYVGCLWAWILMKFEK